MDKQGKVKARTHKVLLLASYCMGTDNSSCTEYSPCIDCLSMCNVFEIDLEAVRKGKFIKNLTYLTENK